VLRAVLLSDAGKRRLLAVIARWELLEKGTILRLMDVFLVQPDRAKRAAIQALGK
jgi:hypothetical protein